MSSKITIRFNGRKIDELLLTRNIVTIGRKLDNDLRLEDTTVSSHHARIVQKEAGVFVEDCDSTNGTLVNGIPVQERKLKNGDVIVVGKYTLTFEQVETEAFGMEDPTLQVGRHELERILERLERAQITHTQSSISIDKKTLNWIAQDENGVWWGFENKPVPGIHGWIDGLDGTKILLKQENCTNTAWRDTLQKLS
ncbi:MAG: FHA domain-containing protein [Gammaproteobacteria bacterium]|nr:FHA domain-containing protein [Gammaproteobacteria bacterium]